MIETIGSSGITEGSLRAILEGVVTHLRFISPDIHWHYDVSGSESFPFWAYASAVRGSGPSADEVLVLSLQCRRETTGAAGVVDLYAEVLRDDGMILAEGPHFEVALNEPRAGYAVDADVAQLASWLEDQSPVIEQALS
ncbi:MAG TPA: hypothetical protein VFB58_01285 [Chloroflexota bacterium]|nr:hypothetical protein [Chloroflexota bacterium]